MFYCYDFQSLCSVNYISRSHREKTDHSFVWTFIHRHFSYCIQEGQTRFQSSDVLYGSIMIREKNEQYR